MIYTIWLLAGAVIGALAAFLAGRPALKRYEQTESGLKNEIEAKNGQLFELNRQVAESRTQCRALEERIAPFAANLRTRGASSQRGRDHPDAATAGGISRIWPTTFWKRRAASSNRPTANRSNSY